MKLLKIIAQGFKKRIIFILHSMWVLWSTFIFIIIGIITGSNKIEVIEKED